MQSSDQTNTQEPAPGLPTVSIPEIPPVSEPIAPTPETFIVPPPEPQPSVSVGQPVSAAGGPEPVTQPVADLSSPGTGLPQANPWPRRILAIVVLLVFLGAIVFAIRLVLSTFSASTGSGGTITYWGLWEDDAVTRPIIADFEAKNPKIKVQYLKQSHQQYRERLQSAITRGEGPDVFRFHNTWVAMLKDNLAPVPATVMSTAEMSSQYPTVMTNDLVAGSTIFGIPMMIDGLGLYYNEDLFAAAGITGPPATWEDVLAMVPKIAKPEGNTFAVSAIALGTTGNVENYSDIVATMLMQNGANIVSPQGKEAEETLIFYRKFANPSDPVYTWNETMDNSIYAFASGKVAMIIAPSWRAFDVKTINPNLRFKIAPIPQLPGNTVNWASYWVEGVNSKGKNQAAAWEFVKYLTSKETEQKLYTEEQKIRLFGEPYARTDLAATILNDPYAGAYVRQAKDARSFPLASRTFDNGLNDRMIKYLENALNGLSGGSSPEKELQTMSAGFQQVLSSYGLVSAAPATTTQ